MMPLAPSRSFPWKRVMTFAEVVGLLLLLIIFAVIIIPYLGAPEIIVLPIILLVIIPLYFLPSLVAVSRGHQNSAAIFALNLLLGWVFIGWVAALVWAFTVVDRPSHG